MPLIYITGNAGAGKSTICQELKRLEYEAHDIDDNGITAWYDKDTGQQVEWPKVAENRTKAWIQQHEFKMVSAIVKEFAKAAQNKPIFLCGQSIHDHEIWDLFDKTFYLELDKETLKYRLSTRTTNDFGKTSAELAAILEVHDTFREKHAQNGAILIDAHKSPEQIVNQILQKLELT